MIKNTASQKVGAQMITAADGTAFTGSVTVAVTVDAGTQATGSVGSGACTSEGGGYHTYAPSQAETNGDLVAFTFSGTGAVSTTVQIYTRAATPDVNVASIAANAITATAIASDAITDAKVASDVTIASVTGAVGSVTGAVGSVTGAVGSVTGNVGGNVTGSVGSVATGGITAASFAADAITAAKLAADVTTELQSGLATASALSTVSGLVDDLEGRLTATRAGYLDNLSAGAVALEATAQSILTDTGTTLQAELDAIEAAVITNAAGVDIAADIIALKAETAAILVDTGTTLQAEVDDIQSRLPAALTGDGNMKADALKFDGAAPVQTAGKLWVLDGSGNAIAAAAALQTVDDELATVDTVVDAIKVTTDRLDDTLEDDAGTYRFTTNALEQAPTGGSAPSAADIADAVWDEDLTGHTATDSAGDVLGNVATGSPPTASAIADAVWDEATSGHATSGTFGKAAADILADTNELQTDDYPTTLATLATSAELAKVPKSDGTASWNATALAAINTQADLAFTDYDPPTRTEATADKDAILAILGTPNSTIAADVIDVRAGVDNVETDTQDIQSNLANVPTAAENADALLGRTISGGANGGRTVGSAFRAIRNKQAISAGTLTVYEEDDTTAAWTAAVTTTAGDPISAVDPS